MLPWNGSSRSGGLQILPSPASFPVDAQASEWLTVRPAPNPARLAPPLLPATIELRRVSLSPPPPLSPPAAPAPLDVLPATVELSIVRRTEIGEQPPA